MGKEKKSKLYFRKLSKEMQEKLLSWWRSLAEKSGTQAQLCRCATPEEAALNSETFRLLDYFPWIDIETAAIIAGILSHIKQGEEENISFLQKLATPKEKNGRVPFSEIRFRQLLTCRTWDEFFTALRRAVQVLDGRVNPLSIADGILRWAEEQKSITYCEAGRSLKFDWSKEYYTEALKYE